MLVIGSRYLSMTEQHLKMGLPTNGNFTVNTQRSLTGFRWTTFCSRSVKSPLQKSQEKLYREEIEEEKMTSSRKRSLEEVKAAGEKKKQKVTQLQRRHHGLYNQGATCYLNSVLQVLVVTTEIHDRLDPESHNTDQELRNMFKKLEETTCATERITKSLEITNFHQQRDAAECLEMILHKISPKASEVFQGELKYLIKCSKGHSINEDTDPFWTLPLSLKDTCDTTYSVEKGFERIFKTKSFSGDNMVYCNECKQKTEATSKCELVKSPQILTLLLKRFDFDFNTMSHVKSHCCVDVPCNLKTKNKKYKLFGMVDHMGGLYGGHYTATVLSNEDETWYDCDDENVKKVEEQPFAKTGNYNSSTAYLLVYRGSLRDEVKEESDKIGLSVHLKEQRRHKQENQRKLGQRDADDEENQQNQESQGPMNRGEESNANHEMVSSFNEDMIKEDVLLHRKQNTSHSGKQRPDNWTKAEKRKLRSKQEEDEKSPQPCESSINIKKKPLWIFLITLGFAFIEILIVMLIYFLF